MTRLIRLLLLVGLCSGWVGALASSAIAAADEAAEAAGALHLSELLRATRRGSPLISLSATQMERWVEGSVSGGDSGDGAAVAAAAAAARPYTLLVFLTASQSCVACRAVERELAIVAARYEQARFPALELADPSGHGSARQSPRPPARSHPAHHIFFLSMDAHRDEGRSGGGMRNLAWFQSRNISKVPELLLLHYTVPEGMQRGSGPADASDAHEGARAEGVQEDEAEAAVDTATSRRQKRYETFQTRRRERQQRMASREAASKAAASGPADDAAAPADAAAAGAASPAATSSAAPVAPLLSWRDPNQTVSFPLSTGVQAGQILAWVRQHTETHVIQDAGARARAAERDAKEDLPLHRSLVVRRSGLPLGDTAATATPGASPNGAEEPGRLSRFFWSIQPFISSLLLLVLMCSAYLFGHVRLAAIPTVFFLWNVAGAMNNILKDMPLVGMAPNGGPMFFYPGHGSFVGESAFIAIIYAACAYSVIALNRVELWERLPTPGTAAVSASALAPTASAGSSHAPSPASDAASGAVDIQRASKGATQASGATVLPHPIRSDGVTAGAAQRPRPRAVEEDPAVLTPAQWALFFICTLHVAFSLLRSIYTRKNGRYNWGYVF